MDFEKWNNTRIKVSEWCERIARYPELFLDFYFDEAARIGKLDERNRSLQLNQLLEIQEGVYKLKELEKQRVKEIIKQDLVEKGVKQLSSEYSKQEIVSLWKKSFCANLTQEEMDMCHTEEFLWHVFTYKMIDDYLQYDEAEKAFNNHKKNKIYIFSQWNDQVYYLQTNNNLTASHLRLEMSSELCIVDEKFEWTYVLPHSADGPIWYHK